MYQFYVLRYHSTYLCFIAFSAYSKGGDWPNWRGPSMMVFQPRLPGVWKKRSDLENSGVGFSSISVVDNLVYKGMMEEKGKETVYCLSAKTERWFGPG